MTFIEDLIESMHKPKNYVGLVAFMGIIIVMGYVFHHAAANTDVVSIGGQGSTLFNLKFNETSEDMSPISGNTNEGETTIENIPINHTNITKITFKLTWSDDVPPADTFILTIKAPEDADFQTNFTPTDSESSSSGEIIIEAEINTLPETISVKADSPTNAASYHTTYMGSGDWTAEIELEDAQPDGFIFDPDSSNDWTLDVTIHYYTAIIKEATEEIDDEA